MVTRLIRFGLGRRVAPRSVQTKHPDVSAFCAIRRRCAGLSPWANFSASTTRAGLDPGDDLALGIAVRATRKLLDSRGARHVDLGETLADDIEPHEHEAVGAKPRRHRFD